MHQRVQTDFCGAIVDGVKFPCGDAEFVAADAEGHDGFRIAALCGFDDFHRCVRTKLPCGIEYPLELEPATFEWLRGAEESFEIRFRALLSEEHHPDGKRYFGIDHALREQMFGKFASDERVCR